MSVYDEASVVIVLRDQCLQTRPSLAAAVIRRLPLDASIDQLGKRLMQQRQGLPLVHFSA